MSSSSSSPPSSSSVENIQHRVFHAYSQNVFPSADVTTNKIEAMLKSLSDFHIALFVFLCRFLQEASFLKSLMDEADRRVHSSFLLSKVSAFYGSDSSDTNEDSNQHSSENSSQKSSEKPSELSLLQVAEEADKNKMAIIVDLLLLQIRDLKFPGFSPMNMYLSLFEKSGELSKRGMSLESMRKQWLVQKSPASTPVFKHLNKYMMFAKRRLCAEFPRFDRDFILDVVTNNWSGPIALIKKSQQETRGTMMFLSRVQAWERNGESFEGLQLPCEKKQQRDFTLDSLNRCLAEELMKYKVTMDQLLTYALFVHLVLVDMDFFQEETNFRSHSRPSKRRVHGKETREQYQERKKQEAVANGDILSEYYEKPRNPITSSALTINKFEGDGKGTLSLDHLDKLIYPEDEEKKFAPRELTDEQKQEQERVLEEILEERRKKRVEQKTQVKPFVKNQNSQPFKTPNKTKVELAPPSKERRKK